MNKKIIAIFSILLSQTVLAQQFINDIDDNDNANNNEIQNSEINKINEDILFKKSEDNKEKNEVNIKKEIPSNLISYYENKMTEIKDDVLKNNYHKYIVINIPTYKLKGYDSNNQETFSTKVIVGRSTRQTPKMKTMLTSIKYNPEWNPPPGILKKDILPKWSKYISSHKIKILDSSGNIVNVSKEQFLSGNYRLVQPASYNSALGELKFELDNSDNIYLHDTNERYLFKKEKRALSSGCVRIHDYKDLASWVTDEDISVIEKNLQKRKTYWQKVNKIPVYIIYSLVDLDENNEYKLFENIYDIKNFSN